MFNLGVIVPQSYILPQLSRDLPIACQMGIEKAHCNINLVLEPGVYNEDINVLKEKTQGMIMRNNLHALICPLNPSLIGPLSELCEAEQIILIVNTMGEDVVFDTEVNDSVLINSYQLWQTAWLTGLHAAKSGYENLVAIYSRHDGGYGVPLAMAVGAEAGGANIKLSQITHMDKDDEDCEPILREIDKLEPDAILAHHSGKQAVNFLFDADQAELKSPLITLSPFVETIALEKFCPRIEGINSVSTYKADSADYLNFSSEFKDKTQRHSHPHIIMAYESVKLLTKALATNDSASYSSLLSALKLASTDGPRGNVSFNPDFKESLSKAYIREVSKNDSGELLNKTVGYMDVPELCHEQYKLAQKNMQKQGWVNPYLIA